MTFKNSMAYAKIQKENRYKKPDLPNRVNQNTDVASELEERELIADKTIRVMKKMLPDILKDLAVIKDYRKKNVKYSLVMLQAYGILMFALHYTSRRETNREMTAPVLRENLKVLFPELETLPHGDTLYRLLDHIEVGQIEEAQIQQLRRMIANKKFVNYLVDKKYRIAIDGTQKFMKSIKVNTCDKKAPNKPTINSYKVDSYVVSGTAEKNSTVTVTVSGRSYTCTTSSKGYYKCPLSLRLLKGNKIEVIAQDISGNISIEAEVNIK